jgi:ribosomal protein S18 acetylase RimI-like enzyme
VIHLARPSDAEEIARVHIAAWREVYRGHVPAEALDALAVVHRAKVWGSIIAHGPGNVAVVKTGECIVGFVSIRTSEDADAEVGAGELLAIHVAPMHWQQGFGRLLMGWACASAVQRGWNKMTLWVFKENFRARSFYEALHWKLDGKQKSDLFGGETLSEVRYQRYGNA